MCRGGGGGGGGGGVIKSGAQLSNFLSLIKVHSYVPARPGPEVIKLFFILNSAEHEIYPTHKC